jgi:AraC-like DNA-binding protein
MNRSLGPKEHVKFWRDPVLPDLEMLRATYVTHAFSRHAHEGFGISIIEAGAMAFEYRGATHVAPAGSVVVTHPGEIHTGQAAFAKGWTYRTLLPAADWLQQVADELSNHPKALPYFSSPVIDNALLNRQFIALHHILETSSSTLERESCLIKSMAQLIGGYASNRPLVRAVGKEHRAVQQVCDYLTAHYRDNIPLSELATLVNLHPLRLLRSFRQQVGLPPHAFLNQVRINQARRLLLSGWSIADTAIETGFSDQSHLHRHFKKMLGVTPGQYARGCKNVQDLRGPLR